MLGNKLAHAMARGNADVTALPAEPHMLDVLQGFVHELRTAGLPVSMTEMPSTWSGVSRTTVGPESVAYAGQAARAELAFLPSELAMISPPTDGVSVGGFAVGSISLGIPDYYCGEPAVYDGERTCW